MGSTCRAILGIVNHYQRLCESRLDALDSFAGSREHSFSVAARLSNESLRRLGGALAAHGGILVHRCAVRLSPCLICCVNASSALAVVIQRIVSALGFDRAYRRFKVSGVKSKDRLI